MIFTLTKGANMVDLTASPYCLAGEPDFGGVTRSWESYGGSDLTLPRFGPTATTTPRAIPVSVEIYGTSADTLATSRVLARAVSSRR